MVDIELSEDFTDEEMEAYIDNLVKDIEKFNQDFDKFDAYMGVLEELYYLLECINNKISILRKLIPKKIEEQYLIDLFLSETIALFEGFNFSFLSILGKYLEHIDYDSPAKLDHFFKNFNVKVKNNMEKNLYTFLSDSSKKTLNDPFLIQKLFSQIFKIDVNFLDDKEITPSLFKKCIEVRNAHMHRNGEYKQEKFSFNEIHNLMNYYIKFIDKAALAVNSHIKTKISNFEN